MTESELARPCASLDLYRVLLTIPTILILARDLVHCLASMTVL